MLTGPDGAVLPAEQLDGLQLWSLTATRPWIEATGPTNPKVLSRSLLGHDGQPRMLITVTDATTSPATVISPDQATRPQRVRGQDGQLTSEGSPPTPDRLTWIERGATLTVRFRQLTLPQALAIVNGLRWAGPEAADGFTPPADLRSLPIPTAGTGAPQGLLTTSTYAAGPAGAEVEVTSCPDGSGGCSDDFASTWFAGTLLADGSAEEPVLDGSGAAVGLSRVWPGGGSIDVQAPKGTLPLASARDLIDSARPADPTELARRQARVSERLLSLPKISAAGLVEGTVRVRASGRLIAVCLVVGDQPEVCPSATFSDAPLTATAPFTGSVLVDGHWWVAGASLQVGALSFQPDTGDLPPSGTPYPAHDSLVTTEGQSWQLGLAQIPDGIDDILVTHGGPLAIGGGGATRPAR